MDKVIFNIGGVNIEMDKEEASKAIEAGTPIELKTTELTMFTSSELETYKKSLSDNQYKKGRIDSAEMLMKEIKDQAGADFTGKVVKNETENVDYKETASLFVNGITPILEKKVNQEPSEKLKEALSANEILRTNYQNLETDFNGFKTKIAEKETRANKDNTIMGFIPDNIIVDKDIALISLKMKAGLDIGDGGIALINGQPTKDKLEQDVALSQDIVINKLTDLGLIKKIEGSGNGNGDDLGAGSTGNYEKFVKEMESNDILEGSEKFSEEMNKRIKDKTLVM